MTTEILILLIAFQLKHLIADYYLQFPYMYENKGKDKNWIKPLLDHSSVHMVLTAFIVFIYGVNFLEPITEYDAFVIYAFMPIFDYTTHFVTDRWKATQKTNPTESWFWVSLGIDQMIHHIVGIFIIYTITTF